MVNEMTMQLFSENLLRINRAEDGLTGVITRKGQGLYDVRLGEQTQVCRLATRFIKEHSHQADLAVGDVVQVHPLDAPQWFIEARLPRRNVMLRRDPSSPRLPVSQAIAANLDLAAVVFACANPTPKWGLLDRYLVSAEAAGIPAVIFLTKIDLLSGQPEAMRTIDQMREVYEQIGYEVVRFSDITRQGLDAARQVLQGRLAAVLGKSGVGKTSLLNALQPGLGLQVGQVSRATGKGKHTTTAMQMFFLDEIGGAVIDTPGVREFGLWEAAGPDLAMHFPEMRPFVGRCRFGMDCRHDQEPGCAVRQAVTDGKVSPYRYQSYLKLSEE